MLMLLRTCTADAHENADRPGRLMLIMLVHLAFNAEGGGGGGGGGWAADAHHARRLGFEC